MRNIVYIVSDINKALAFEWIATYLDRRQFRLSFVLLNPSSSVLEAYLEQEGIPVRRIVCAGKKDWPRAWWQLICHLKSLKPDVVHCHLFTANLLGLSAARLLRIRKRIYTRHHADYHFRYHPQGVKWDKLSNRWATDIVAPSRVVCEVLTGMEGVAGNKVRLIHHGFDLDYFAHPDTAVGARLRATYNPAGCYPVIGVIARFTELKGIQYIIPAFASLLKTYPRACLLLFNAQGDYQKTIQELLSELPEDSYKTIAFEPNLAEVYHLFDVFIQASTDRHIEAFGQTYVEALAAGIPSVFTLAGIAGDFIKDQENALVVPFEDAAAIEQAMKAILEDPDKAKRMAERGRTDVLTLFNIRQMIDKLQLLYGN